MVGSDSGRIGRAYLYIEQLAEVTPWTTGRIRNLMTSGKLVEGVHYFKPGGPGSRPIFSWRAVSAYIEGKPWPTETATATHEDEIAQKMRALLG